ncbi:MAG: glucose-6-phosphate isomerase [Opitutia bacterium]
MASSFERFRAGLLNFPGDGFSLDLSRAPEPQGFAARMAPAVKRAFEEMAALEKGAVANPDERRMVGHDWLRTPELAPDARTGEAIRAAVSAVERFAGDVHGGRVRGEKGAFTDLLCIGIGGSALGPQFVADALGGRKDRLRVHFIDNTDPDGFDRVFAALEGRLGTTLAVVTSKSGSTPEPRNGQIEAAGRWSAAGLSFARHAVAVTGEGSQLDGVAVKESWLARFPMWDWVGGRTSELGPVGLLPAALQGLDIRGLLAGAARMDELTRVPDAARNPAARLALAWHHLSDGRGSKAMVVLPYKDRLLLLSRYLQQLVMESLGKQLDLKGAKVNQGLTVYGNKGSTDQHAYVQQLRDGVDNFFAVFVEVLQDRAGASPEVEPGVTSGDYLQAFLLGTREALSEGGRASLTVTVDRVDARSVGMLIALFERAVGLYASLVGINAYHQPGVEAGKKAASAALDLRTRALAVLRARPGEWLNCAQICGENGLEGSEELVYKILLHVAANPGRVSARPDGDPAKTLFQHS